MILISKDADWPTTLVVDKTTRIPRREARSAKYIVMDAALDWMRRAGNNPTHILMPMRFRNIFLSQIDNNVEFKMASGGDCEDKFMGFKLIWILSGSLELVGDMP